MRRMRLRHKRRGLIILRHRRSGEIGIRTRLKSWRGQTHVGSSPTSGTKHLRILSEDSIHIRFQVETEPKSSAAISFRPAQPVVPCYSNQATTTLDSFDLQHEE